MHIVLYLYIDVLPNQIDSYFYYNSIIIIIIILINFNSFQIFPKQN